MRERTNSEHAMEMIRDLAQFIEISITPRKIDGRYTPSKVWPIVLNALEMKSYEECWQLLLEAYVENVEYLINAFARRVVSLVRPHIQAMVDRNQKDIPGDLQIYLKKHLRLSERGTRYVELSIADLIEDFDLHNDQKIKIIDGTGVWIGDGLTSLYGSHMLNQILPNISFLKIHDSSAHWGPLSYDEDPDFPTAPFCNFFHLRELGIHGLFKIPSFFLVGIPSLEYLVFNGAQEINKDVFNHVKQLKLLKIEAYKGAKLDEHLFDSLSALKALYLDKDNASSNSIPLSLASLKELAILENIFIAGFKLEEKVFEHNKHLQQVTLVGNDLSEFSLKTFLHLSLLKSISLLDNYGINNNFLHDIKKYAKKADIELIESKNVS